jgi:hypothetical protein
MSVIEISFIEILTQKNIVLAIDNFTMAIAPHI